MLIKSINPATGELIREFEEMQMSQVDAVLDDSVTAFHLWRKEPISKRQNFVQRLGELLITQKEKLATTISLEMGKPIQQSRAEIEKCASLCHYYAENAASFLESQNVETEFKKSYVAFQPLGVVLAIMPWNYPFWQVLRFSIPALLAGNSVVLKHASNVPGCSVAIEQLMKEAGFPTKVFQSLILTSSRIGGVISDRRVQAITFTGSTPAGRSVGALAGKSIKKSVLELGGSDPAIILADANLTHAAEACVKARLANAGQSCISPKRFIVETPVYEEFQHLVVEGFKKVIIGDPMDEKTQIGPLARVNLRLDLEAQVNNSIEKGSELLLGGGEAPLGGNYYMPTVLGDVERGAPAWNEELFGPVAALIKASDLEEAIRIANDTTFGLGASIYTEDLERAQQIAENELEAGTCFVNDFVRSDPRLPFGGIKESGYGRELSLYGLREFVNIKTIVIS